MRRDRGPRRLSVYLTRARPDRLCCLCQGPAVVRRRRVFACERHWRVAFREIEWIATEEETG